MKAVLAVTIGILGAGIVSGGPSEQAILAAMRLSECPNYTWTTVVVDDVRDYVIHGKTERAGFTWVQLPMVPAMARRLGRGAGPHVEAIFKEGANCVVRTDVGWTPLDALPRRHDDWIDNPPTASSSLGLLGGILLVPTGPTVSPRSNLCIAEPQNEAYTNAQFGLSHPHEELAIIVCSNTDLDVQGNRATGRLTDIGAQLLLLRNNDERIKPIAAAGAFELLIQDGMVVRYALQLEGILEIKRKKVHVRQNARTTLTHVGVTQLGIPDEARWKLEE